MKNLLSLSIAAILACSIPANALEWQVLGPRALGMGGAGVATAQGPLASYWNPAALGRATENAYGLQIPFGVHAALTGSVIEGANDLEKLKDACTANVATCNSAGEINTALAKLNQPGNGLRIDAGTGADFKVGKVAVFANGFAAMGAVPQIDNVNTSAAQIAAGTNTSKLIVKGARILEFGAGYGQELPFAPGLFLGGNLKLMNAQVGYVDYFVLRNTNDSSNILSKLKDGAKTSSNFGVDLGALWDVAKTFDGAIMRPKIGLVGRNLNNPKFSQPSAATAGGVLNKFAVNPQLRLGAAISPLHWWNIAADLDMTRNLTPVDNVASRQFGLGTEINVFNRPWINIPLRFGLSRNLAETGSGTMLSAGAGLNFLHVILDVSGSISPKRIQTQSQGESKKIPRELAAAMQLSFLFGGSESTAQPSDAGFEPAAKSADDQPVPTTKIREAAEKAHKELDKEAASPTAAPATAPAPAPSGQ